MNTTFISAGLFSPAQITGIVLISVLLAAVLALNGYLGYLLHKRGARRLQTQKLHLQRNALLAKLEAMRAGATPEDVAAMGATETEQEPEEEESEEAEIEVEEFGDGEDEEIFEPEVTAEGNVVRYNRSFTARITQADNDLKGRYSELKNYIMAFRGIRSRMSWKRETFHMGRKSVASFVVRGKTLCLCLATDPQIFDGSKYKVDDISGRNNKNKMPCMFRIRSDRRMGYAKELTDIVMAGFGLEKNADYKADDFTLPYKSTEVLIKKRLIKVVSGVRDSEKEDALAAAKGIRYNRSFEARIIQADDSLKANYSKLKNHITAYKEIIAAFSWKRETFRKGRTCVATFMIRGKTLCLGLAANPAQYENTKYTVEDLSKRSKNTKTPLLYRVKNERRINYAMQLIDRVFAEHGIEKGDGEYVNYAVPFTATDTLVRRGLIRVITGATPQFGQFKAEHQPQADTQSQAEPLKEVAATEQSKSNE